MQRMSAMDAAFLYSEDGRSHNDVGMVLVLEGPALSRDELVQALRDRLALFPRFRQKVRHLPYAATLPVWVDDPAFDLAGHVFEDEVDPTGSDSLGEAVSRVMSDVMDLKRPLWEVHVARGLPDARWALVVKMHHAMVDGVSSAEIVRTLLSPSPEGDPPVPDSWTPSPEPSDIQLLADAAVDTGRAAAKFVGSLAGGAATPSTQAVKDLDLGPLLQPGLPISATAINGPIQAGRRWGMLEVELSRLKHLSKRHRCTVNDILLAACGQGFSTLIASRGEVVQDRVIRAVVPVSLKPTGQQGTLEARGDTVGGNNIGAMVVDLPLGQVDPATRLTRIREQTAAFKRLKDAMPAPAINPGPDLTSPLTLILGTRVAAASPTVVNTVITNVPGPQTPLFLSGRRMHRLGACIALWSPLRIAVSVLSYDGVATIGVVSDAASFPDVHPLLDSIRDGLDDLDSTPG